MSAWPGSNSTDRRTELDRDHYLEPIDADSVDPRGDHNPIVTDLRGQRWRVRRRSSWGSSADWLALIAFTAMLLAMVVVIWLHASA